VRTSRNQPTSRPCCTPNRPTSVNAPITNVHISNEGNNNSNNTIVGDNNVIINANFGITINA